MKATLEFNLPDDSVAFYRAAAADEMAAAINDAMIESRKWLKYGHEFTSVEQAVEAFRDILIDASDIASRDA